MTNLNLVLNDEKINAAKLEKVEKVAKVITTIVLYALLVVMALIVLIPFYWMIITSLKSNAEVIASHQTFFPKVIMWQNYAEALGPDSTFEFWTYLKNTLVVGIFSTIGTLFTTIFSAFAFARLNFKGKNVLFTIFLATMMIPGEMLVITNYITVAKLGWIGTNLTGAYLSMIIPFWVSVFYIYLLRQYFKQIPYELYYAAKVDGKSDWQYLWKVMVPIAMPTLISIFILKLMGAWNSYVWPNLVADRPEWRIISNGLRGAFQDTSSGHIRYELQMAATVVVTVPLLLLFIFFRKYIMRGVSRAGLKG